MLYRAILENAGLYWIILVSGYIGLFRGNPGHIGLYRIIVGLLMILVSYYILKRI